MKLDKVVEGKHNREAFRYENGMLVMFGRRWDKEDVKTLVEVSNLLQLEGYKLKEPTGREQKERFDMFYGGTMKYDVKTYDEPSEEK